MKEHCKFLSYELYIVCLKEKPPAKETSPVTPSQPSNCSTFFLKAKGPGARLQTYGTWLAPQPSK